MVSKVCSIYDSGVGAYSPVLHFRAKGEATRWWTQQVNDASLPFNKSPGDFTLFEIGEFDDQTGMVKMHVAHESLGLATEYLHKEQ